MKTAQQWLDAYGESHQNPTNKTIHWVCIPLIVTSLVGLLWGIDLPFGGPMVNAGTLLVAFGIAYYLTLSTRLAIGMAVVCAGVVTVVYALSLLPIPLWASSTAIFVGAWIAQFIGHKIEGKKPSFFEDLQFLMIGPAWLLSAIYRRANIEL